MHWYLRPVLPVLAALASLYWVSIFIATHVPVEADAGIDHLDKVAHAIAYAGLAFMVGCVLAVWRGYQWLVPLGTWSVVVAYGAFDEYSQQFVPGRSCDVIDLLADALGAAAGLLALHGAVLIARRFRPPVAAAAAETVRR